MIVRNSNIELIRCLCILMIISMHVFGEYSDMLNDEGLFYYCLNTAICQPAVSVFMLISGYYGIRFKIDKIVNLLNVTLFWSIVMMLFDANLNLEKVLKSFFPVSTGKYWFFTVYFIIYCLSSYIDIIINVISRRKFKILIAILLFFFVISPTIFYIEILRDSGKGVLNMLLVYLIGRYMALYGIPKYLTKTGTGGGILLGVILFVTGVDYIVPLMINKNFQGLARDNSIFVLIAAISLLAQVMRNKPKSIGWINEIATYVFPIYIINYVLVRNFVTIPESLYTIMYPIIWLWTIVVALVSVGLEFLRRITLNKLFCILQKKEVKIVEIMWSKVP